jgi:hypothetical protein
MATTTTSYIGNSYPADFTADQQATGRCYTSISAWRVARGGDLASEDRLEIGQVVVELIGNQDLTNGDGLTSATCYFQIEPVTGQDRFYIDKNATDSTGLLIGHTSYTRVLNCSVHNGRSTTSSPGMTGIWIQGCSYVKLINPEVFDLIPGDGTGIATGGIHVGYTDGDLCSECEVINPIVYNIIGSTMVQGIFTQGNVGDHTVVGATVYGLDRTQYGTPANSAGVLIRPGTGATVKNCISICASTLNAMPDFADFSTGLISDFNMSSDTSAPGSTVIHNAVASSEFFNAPAGIFLLLPGASAVDAVTSILPAYDYDFDGNARGASPWNMGAAAMASAATKYYVGLSSASSVFDNSLCWSLTSGGTGGAGTPDASDTAIFDLNSPSCDVDAINIVLSGYEQRTGFSGYVNAYYSTEFKVVGDVLLASGQFKFKDGITTFSGTTTDLRGTCVIDHSNGHVVLDNHTYIHFANKQFYDVTISLTSAGPYVDLGSAPTSGGMTYEGTLTFGVGGRVICTGPITIKWIGNVDGTGGVVNNSGYTDLTYLDGDVLELKLWPRTPNYYSFTDLGGNRLKINCYNEDIGIPSTFIMYNSGPQDLYSLKVGNAFTTSEPTEVRLSDAHYEIWDSCIVGGPEGTGSALLNINHYQFWAGKSAWASPGGSGWTRNPTTTGLFINETGYIWWNIPLFICGSNLSILGGVSGVPTTTILRKFDNGMSFIQCNVTSPNVPWNEFVFDDVILHSNLSIDTSYSADPSASGSTFTVYDTNGYNIECATKFYGSVTDFDSLSIISAPDFEFVNPIAYGSGTLKFTNGASAGTLLFNPFYPGALSAKIDCGDTNTGIISFTGQDIEITDVFKAYAGNKLRFTSGNTYKFDVQPEISGTVASRVEIDTTSAGSQCYFYTTFPLVIRRCTLKDNNYSGTATATAYTTTDNGNNTNWNILAYTLSTGSGVLIQSKKPFLQGPNRTKRYFYYSVGASYPSDLKTGLPKIKIASGRATFNIEQTGNIGAGDRITYGSGQICYLAYKYSASEWQVKDNGATNPPDTDYVDVLSIKRCFPNIHSAIGSVNDEPISTGIAGPDCLGTANLVNVNAMVNVLCYRDGGSIDGTPVKTIGYTSCANNSISISPAGANLGGIAGDYFDQNPEYGDGGPYSNYAQHTLSGIPGEGYVLQINSNQAEAAIDVFDNMLFVNNMDICGSVDIGVRMAGNTSFPQAGLTANNCRVKNCIIRNTGRYGIVTEQYNTVPTFYVGRALSNFSVWSCLIYGQSEANVYFKRGVVRGFLYNTILDKGGSDSNVVGFKMNYSNSFNMNRFDACYNIFVGGKPQNDITTNTGFASTIMFFNNLGNDPNWFGKNTSNLQLTVIEAQSNKLINTSLDDMFVNRTGLDYNIKSRNSQQYLAGPFPNPEFDDSIAEVYTLDIRANFRSPNKISYGPFAAPQRFEFSGADIIAINEQKLEEIPVYETFSDSQIGKFRSTYNSVDYYHAFNSVKRAVNSSTSEYVKEAKIAIRIKVIPFNNSIEYRKYREVGQFNAIYDIGNNMIFVDKNQAFDSAFFSRMVGSKNYIFSMDAARRYLIVGVIDELEKGMSGKNNIINQVRFGR